MYISSPLETEEIFKKLTFYESDHCFEKVLEGYKDCRKRNFRRNQNVEDDQEEEIERIRHTISEGVNTLISNTKKTKAVVCDQITNCILKLQFTSVPNQQ